METCVLYLRESDERAEEDDFEIQEEKCREYAQKKGYAILNVYREAHSGKHSPMTRVVLRQAISDIKEKRAGVIVVRTYDRLARTIEQTYAILFEIEQLYHGRVEAAQESLDRTSGTAKIQFAVLAAASELERDRIFERTEAGKRRRVREGKLMAVSHPRYGYRFVDDSPGKRTAYEEDPESAAVVRQIFEWAANGMSTGDICRTLNSQGVLPPSQYAALHRDPGNRVQTTHWHREQIRHILQHPGYAGKPVAYKDRYTREYRGDAEKVVRSANGDSVALPLSSWPAIVSPEIFSVVQQRMQMNIAGRKPTNPEAALMKGHVWCGVCGHKMIAGKNGSGYYVYACSKRSTRTLNAGETCPGGNFNIRCHIVDKIGWEHVTILMESKEQFAKMLYDQVESREDAQHQLRVAIGALKQQQDQYDNVAASLALATTDVSRRAVLAQMTRLEAELEKLEQQAKQARDRAEDTDAGTAWVEHILQSVYGWHESGIAPDMDDYDKLPWEVKKLAVRASTIHIDLYPTGWRPDGKRVIVRFELPTSSSGTWQFTLQDVLSSSAVEPVA